MFSLSFMSFKAMRGIYSEPLVLFPTADYFQGSTLKVIFATKSHLNGTLHSKTFPALQQNVWKQLELLQTNCFPCVRCKLVTGSITYWLCGVQMWDHRTEPRKYSFWPNIHITSILHSQATFKPAGDWWLQLSVWVFLVLYQPLSEWNAPKLEETIKTKPGSPALPVGISFLVVSRLKIISAIPVIIYEV